MMLALAIPGWLVEFNDPAMPTPRDTSLFMRLPGCRLLFSVDLALVGVLGRHPMGFRCQMSFSKFSTWI